MNNQSHSSVLAYTDPMTNYSWQLSVEAAKIVPMGYQGLPPSKEKIQFVRVRNPSLYGIPEHPLLKIYPEIEVIHFGMVINFNEMAEEVNGKRGIAFWLNNRGSDPCVSITSELGRCNVAPIGWEVGEDASRDPRAKPFWEWRTVVQNGLPWTWTNARMHGWAGWGNEHFGGDWLDGCPVSVEHMYDPQLGKTRQTIIVPASYGLGTAQQTLPAEALVDTYSIMLYFPRLDKKPVWEKLKQFGSLMTYPDAIRMYNNNSNHSSQANTRSAQPSTFGVPKSSPLESAVSPAVEIAHGNELSQHVIMPINDSTLWCETPAAVIVCWPVTPEQAAQMNRPSEVSPGRRGVTW